MENNYNLLNDDSTKWVNYEFSAIPYERLNSQEPNPFGNFPPVFNIPQSNYPPGPPPINHGFTPPNIPKGPPPNYIPSKKDKGVQSFNAEEGPSAKMVSPNSIRFCLYKFTYIWEMNGRSYWTFLLNVDRYSVSGFRWLGRNWVYFGLDLRRIDSFICYRSDTFCEDCREVEDLENKTKIAIKEYSLNETRDIYTEVLSSINIPEVKEDYITETIGYVDDAPITTQIPCLKYRTTTYNLLLQVSYPNDYDELVKGRMNKIAKKLSLDTYNSVVYSRLSKNSSNPLEIFNKSIVLIPEILKSFSSKFIIQIEKIDKSYKDISFSIKEEVICHNWNIFNNNKL